MSAPQNPRHPHHPRRPGTTHRPHPSGHSRLGTPTHRPRVSTSPSSTQAAEEADQTAPAATIAADEVATATKSAQPRRLARPVSSLRISLPIALGAATVALGAFAIVAAAQANTLTSEPVSQNTALTDSATTSQITSQVSSTVNSIFSYSYTDIARTQQAASKALTGAAVGQYAKAIRTVVAAAIPDKLVVTTAVTYAGVEYLHGDRAHVLLFVNLSDTSGVTGQTSNQPGMLAVDVVRLGATWKITNIRTFTGAA